MEVLIADDHGLVLDTLKAFVERLDPSIKVHTATNLGDAIEIARPPTDIEVVILDLNMPGMNGLDGITTMKTANPNVSVALMSGAASREEVMRAIAAGAAGFLPKTLNAKALVSALQLLRCGEKFVPWGVLSNEPEAAGETVESPPPADHDAAIKLTARERQVLDRIMNGESNKEIARALDLREVTVKLHLRGVYRKLGVKSRLQAARKATELL